MLSSQQTADCVMTVMLVKAGDQPCIQHVRRAATCLAELLLLLLVLLMDAAAVMMAGRRVEWAWLHALSASCVAETLHHP